MAPEVRPAVVDWRALAEHTVADMPLLEVDMGYT